MTTPALEVTIPLRPMTLAWPMRCDRCPEDLEAHQPDPHHPERLLLCCQACGEWTLIVHSPDGDQALAMTLPDGPALSALMTGGGDGAGAAHAPSR
jgi:hypothetical protein